MKVGDLVKYRRCGTYGVVTRTWATKSFYKDKYRPELMLEVLWSDGKISDTRCRRVEAVCK